MASRYWGRVGGYVGQLGDALPVRCAPFRDHAAGVMRRIDCARMSGCVAHAAKLGWESFTCGYCAVRETIAIETPMRSDYDGSVPYPNPHG